MAFKAFVICIIVGLMVLTISAEFSADPLESSEEEMCPESESFFDGCNVCLCYKGIKFGCTKGPCPLPQLIPPSYELFRNIARAIEKVCAERNPISQLQCGYMFNKTVPAGAFQ
ncbi:uncharacterized protein LOC118647273 [Monomorium pharaonis]|uniref:uncharacterized protein LOC118647273 n=1 Tax=Monomorium pharaonis TaxID=307658 RepID=UPI001747294D|nr:uncharacterized protein LOC118647273 [Monomorium pharaonis]